MKRNSKKPVWSAWVALIALALACNVPTGVAGTPDFPATAAAQTVAAELTAAAALNPVDPAVPAPSPTSTPTSALPPVACTPTVTATTDANVRGGPGTGYAIHGFLPVGGTAPLAGRNDANTWWYVEFAGGPGGHAWIAQSVTTATCLPTAVAVVAAPPLPTAPPTSPGGGGPLAITSVTYDVSTFDEGGFYDDCPIVTAHITANGEGDVQFHWTRSDGAGAPVQNLHFNAAGTKNVTQRWYLGSVWAGGSAEWLGVYIDDPNHQDFGHVNVPACASP